MKGRRRRKRLKCAEWTPSHLKLYGLTKEAYAALRDSQNGLCAICQQKRSLCVDHDHDSGLIRGFLCGPCNSGLGFFGDNARRLFAAFYYLHYQAYGGPKLSQKRAQTLLEAPDPVQIADLP
jgi:recombination endonuclease VII